MTVAWRSFKESRLPAPRPRRRRRAAATGSTSATPGLGAVGIWRAGGTASAATRRGRGRREVEPAATPIVTGLSPPSFPLPDATSAMPHSVPCGPGRLALGSHDASDTHHRGFVRGNGFDAHGPGAGLRFAATCGPDSLRGPRSSPSPSSEIREPAAVIAHAPASRGSRLDRPISHARR
jgi:hypothetical protein